MLLYDQAAELIAKFETRPDRPHTGLDLRDYEQIIAFLYHEIERLDAMIRQLHTCETHD